MNYKALKMQKTAINKAKIAEITHKYQDAITFAVLFTIGSVLNSTYLHAKPPLFDKKLSDEERSDIVATFQSRYDMDGLKICLIEDDADALESDCEPRYDKFQNTVYIRNYEFEMMHELGHAKNAIKFHKNPPKIPLNKIHIAETVMLLGLVTLLFSKKKRDKLKKCKNVGRKFISLFEEHPWVPIALTKMPELANEAIADVIAVKEMYHTGGRKGGARGVGLAALQLVAGYVAPAVANSSLAGYICKKLMKVQGKEKED